VVLNNKSLLRIEDNNKTVTHYVLLNDYDDIILIII